MASPWTAAGNAYVTGQTGSTQATFPVAVGPDLTFNGSADAFVVKVNAAGTGIVYGGYIGGGFADYGYGIAVDGSGSAYVTGFAQSDETTFPVTVGPDLTYNGGVYDAFVAKVNAAGTGLDYCGYIGGDNSDIGYGIAADSSGNAYVTGYASSTEATFPVTVGPDLTNNGGQDAFVAKVNAAGTALLYCGFIGGSDAEQGNGIAVDGSGNAYVTGQTGSSETTFPVALGPDLTYNGGQDAFVASVNAAGTALLYCGYIGGGGPDPAFGIAVDTSGNAYVTGYTLSNEASFPGDRRAGLDLQRRPGRLRREDRGRPAANLVTPVGLAVDVAGNRVLDPNEVAILSPSWSNSGNAIIALTGTATNFTGPAGPVYAIPDGAADYGTIGIGETAECSNCYSLALTTGLRPVQHWDSTFDENVVATLRSGGAPSKVWTLHVGNSFTDVSTDIAVNPFYPFIETIFHKGITGGCGGTSYCPQQNNLRQEMAVFLLKDLLGSGYVPPNCTGVFQDVPCPATPQFPYSNFIEDLFTRGITTGCQVGPPALFCPGQGVTRAQMSVFLLKALLGSAYVPPNCTGLFADVPCPATPQFPFSNFVEDLSTRGITAGCQVGPPALYCPDNSVTREQMAVFLTKTFGLLLYGP